MSLGVRSLSASRAPLCSFAAMGLLWGSYAAMVPETKARIGVDDGTWGLLLLCSASAGILAMLLAPRVGAALGRAALPLATLAMGAAYLVPGHVTGILAFGLGMAAIGLGSGVLDVLMNARVATIETERGLHLMNLAHGVYSLGYAGGALATGAARSLGAGPPEVFTAVALVILLMALGTLERAGRIAGLRQVAGPSGRIGPLPVIGGLVIMIAFLAENAAEVWSALHIERSLGGSAAEGASGPALLGLTMAAGRLAGQAIVARLPEAGVLRLSLVVAGAGATLAALAQTPLVAQAGFVVLGLGVSVVAPMTFALVGRAATEASRARAIARASVLGYAGFFFGPPLLGALADAFGLRASFLVVAVILVAALPLVALLLRR